MGVTAVRRFALLAVQAVIGEVGGDPAPSPRWSSIAPAP
jgi:hypothetical protein